MLTFEVIVLLISLHAFVNIDTVYGFSDVEAVLDDFADSNYEYFLKKECSDVLIDCAEVAQHETQKIQCWVQYGVCTAKDDLFPDQRCLTKYKTCKEEAENDWKDMYFCGTDYIKCFTTWEGYI